MIERVVPPIALRLEEIEPYQIVHLLETGIRFELRLIDGHTYLLVWGLQELAAGLYKSKEISVDGSAVVIRRMIAVRGGIVVVSYLQKGLEKGHETTLLDAFLRKLRLACDVLGRNLESFSPIMGASESLQFLTQEVKVRAYLPCVRKCVDLRDHTGIEISSMAPDFRKIGRKLFLAGRKGDKGIILSAINLKSGRHLGGDVSVPIPVISMAVDPKIGVVVVVSQDQDPRNEVLYTFRLNDGDDQLRPIHELSYCITRVVATESNGVLAWLKSETGHYLILVTFTDQNGVHPRLVTANDVRLTETGQSRTLVGRTKRNQLVFAGSDLTQIGEELRLTT